MLFTGMFVCFCCCADGLQCPLLEGYCQCINVVEINVKVKEWLLTQENVLQEKEKRQFYELICQICVNLCTILYF